MGFFKNLFGMASEADEPELSYDKDESSTRKEQTEIEIIEQQQCSSNEDNSDDDTPLYSYETVISNYFGIDLRNSPNENWTELARGHNGTSELRTFELHGWNNSFFTKVKAIVIENGGTNFFFEGPYKREAIVDIYFTIKY